MQEYTRMQTYISILNKKKMHAFIFIQTFYKACLMETDNVCKVKILGFLNTRIIEY